MSRRAPDRDAIGRTATNGRNRGNADWPFRGGTMPNHRDAIIDLENLEQLSRTKLRGLWTEELAEKPPAALAVTF